MDVFVCIKPVLKTERKPDDKETIMVNPNDLYAIEEALKWKTLSDHVTVTAISMGAVHTEPILRYALSMGADRAYLITDKLYAGSDTVATARVLAAGIRKIGSFDMIICGCCSIDGSTGQVGGALAEALNVPHTTNVKEVTEYKEQKVYCKRETEHYTEELKCLAPMLITVMKGCNAPRLSSLRGIKRAYKIPVIRLTNQELQLEDGQYGCLGSPTKVSKFEDIHENRNGFIYKGNQEEEGVSRIIELIFRGIY